MNNIVKFSDNFMSDFQKLFDETFLGDWNFPTSKTTLSLNNFPPYNIYTKNVNLPASKDENDAVAEKHTFIEFALAGYKKDEIQVSLSNGVLRVAAVIKEEIPEEKNNFYEPKYSHQGIAKRWFEWQRNISNKLEVKEAKYEDGMLTIELVPSKCDDFTSIPIK